MTLVDLPCKSRLPRLLRFYHMNIFFDRLDAALPYPVVIRLVRTINTMLFLIHIFTCLYFLYSDLEGLDSSSFVYNGYGHAYIRCFYVAMKTQIRDCQTYQHSLCSRFDFDSPTFQNYRH